jgi:hypothetical protein
MLIQNAPVSPLLLSERVKGDSTVNALPELIVPVLRGWSDGHLLSQPKGTKECSLQPHAWNLAVRTTQKKMGEGGALLIKSPTGWGLRASKDSPRTGTPGVKLSSVGTRGSATYAENLEQTQSITLSQEMTTVSTISRQSTTAPHRTATDSRPARTPTTPRHRAGSSQDARHSTTNRHPTAPMPSKTYRTTHSFTDTAPRGDPLPSPIADARRD